MSRKRALHLIGEQPTGTGWKPCLADETHLAKRWSIVQVDYIKTKTQTYLTRRTIFSAARRADAQATLETLHKPARRLPSLKLGDRFPPTGRAIIARGGRYLKEPM